MTIPAQIDLSILIPAYQEMEALQLLLPRLITQAPRLTPAWEILVVDSMTPLDETEKVCKGLPVRHLRRKGGNTYGDAVRTGIAESKGNYVLIMDADGSHNPEQVVRLWKVRQGSDLVIGSRYVNGGVTENPAILIVLSWVVNVTYRVAFGLKVKDVSNSFRLYRGDLLRSIPTECSNFDLVEELLIKICRRCGAEGIREVPITFEKRKKGVSKRNLLAFAFTYLGTMFRLMRVRFE
jgi:dolichol-phosphate mannosyltransferase